jgi:hypothetical protein
MITAFPPRTRIGVAPAIATLLVIWFFLLGACSHPTVSDSVFTHDETVAKQNLEKLIPIGTTLTEAETILTKAGISHSLRSSELFGTEYFPELIRCDVEQHNGWMEAQWHAALVLINDKVVDYRVQMWLTGP